MSHFKIMSLIALKILYFFFFFVFSKGWGGLVQKKLVMVTVSSKMYRQCTLFITIVQYLKFFSVGEMKKVFLGTDLRINLQGEVISLLFGTSSKDHQYTLTFSVSVSPNSVISSEFISKDMLTLTSC